MRKIRIAIAGVGSCASALIQGVEFYVKNPNETIGLMYEKIGGYSAKDLEFVVGFDIDARKVNKRLNEAIFAPPNCNMKVFQQDSDFSCISSDSRVLRGPTLDGFAPHMMNYPSHITFLLDQSYKPLTEEEYQNVLKNKKIDVLLNYMPVGAEEASKFYIENAIKAGVSVVNCMPSYISTEDARRLEKLAVTNKVVVVGSDMRSSYGASRLSEVLQGSILDAGLAVTQHIQTNMAAGATQGTEHIINGVSANTDFLNMAEKYRLKNKHISKENVLRGQNTIRNRNVQGTTMFAGPSLTVQQLPGGEYRGSDNKICNIDMVFFGFAGARYELTCRLSVQDSPNSGAIVFDAIRFCKVARELNILGYLRGVSAWSQKTPPVQMTTADAKFECDALSRRVLTTLTEKQVNISEDDVDSLDFTFQKSSTEYQ